MELKFKDIQSFNMVVEALTKNGYTVETYVKWKEWPYSGIDCFVVSVKEENK